MLYALTVPVTFDEVTELRILEWHAVPGSAFEIGQMVVELETHKVLVEVRAGAPAVLRRILCEAGTWQKPGEPLALLSDSADEALPDALEGLAQPIVTFEIV
jgi:pyruvate/2-oxoglutarate dehydrogenase complex dihydrolipoamide acyltransferase (E2) component